MLVDSVKVKVKLLVRVMLLLQELVRLQVEQRSGQ